MPEDEGWDRWGERIAETPIDWNPKDSPTPHVGRKQAISEVEGRLAYTGVLQRLKQADPSIVRFQNVLTNDENDEWFVEVVYRNGEIGALEGKGMRINRSTVSQEMLERLAAVDEDLQFEMATEPREV